MFYDLNLPWPANAAAAVGGSSSFSSSQPQLSKKKAKQQLKAQNKDQTPSSNNNDDVDPATLLNESDRKGLSHIVTDLEQLGYSYMAWNKVVYSRFDPVAHKNPFATKKDGSPRPLFPEYDPRTMAKLKLKAKQSTTSQQGVVQLSRLTVVLDEASMGKSGHGMVTNNATSLQSYDLLAVRPLNEAAFQHACLTLAELKPFSVDIISFDFSSSPRLPFFLKRSTIHAALENGIMFEVCYGAAVGCKSDGCIDKHSLDSHKARRNLISSTRDLFRVTNGKGIIFSSGVMEAIGLRAPYDVINLATVFGMNPAAARDAISNNCRALLLRAQTRKTYRGVVSHPVIRSAAIGQGTTTETGPSTEQDAALSESKKRKSGEVDPPTASTDHADSQTTNNKRKKVLL